jgi:hypothetical protein
MVKSRVWEVKETKCIEAIYVYTHIHTHIIHFNSMKHVTAYLLPVTLDSDNVSGEIIFASILITNFSWRCVFEKILIIIFC